MDLLDKPARRGAMTVVKYVLVSLLLIISILLLLSGYANGSRHESVKQNAVTVVATATHVRETWDSEDGDEYEVYITYTYRGEEYEDHYSTYSSKTKAYDLIGTEVTIYINPDRPSEQVGDIKKSFIVCCIMGGIFLGLSLASCCIREREYYVDTYGWRREAIEKDIRGRNLRQAAAWLFCGCFSVVCLTFDALFWNAAGLWLLIPGCALLVPMILALRAWILHFGQIRRGEYRITRDTVIEKRKSRDSDGDDIYSLVYINGRSTWNRSVPESIYASSREGDVLDTVYLPGRARPFMIYSNLGVEMPEIV